KAVGGQTAEGVPTVAIGADVRQRGADYAAAALNADAPVGVVLAVLLVEHAAAHAQVEAEVLRQAEAGAAGHVPGVGVAAAEIIGVGDGEAVGLGEGGGGDQLVEVQLAGTRVGVAVEHDVEVDRVVEVDVVADEAVDLEVRVAITEVHARSPHARVETSRRGVGETGLA